MGLVMVVLATVLALGTVRVTFDRTVDRIAGATLGADVFVESGTGVDAETITAIEDLDESAVVSPMRWSPTRLETPGRTRRAEVVAVDPSTYFEVMGLPLVRGSESHVRAVFAAGDRAAVISEHDVRALDLQLGDTFPLETPGGDVDVELVGVMLNLDRAWHPIYVAGAVADELYGHGPPTSIRVAAADGTSVGALEAAVKRTVADRADLFVRRGDSERAARAGFHRQFFSIFQTVVLVALVVGLLGLANTLAFSVLRRTREVGILRATGTQRREVVAMVAVEALTLAGAAAVLAVPVGMVIAALVVKTVSASLAATIPLQLTWTMIPVVAVTAIVLGLAAALFPARRAARLDPVVSLRFD